MYAGIEAKRTTDFFYKGRRRKIKRKLSLAHALLDVVQARKNPSAKEDPVIRFEKRTPP
jgi:hypothetical protein